MHADSLFARTAPQRWQPSAFVKASAAFHAGAGMAVAASPGLWPWALGALALDHALLTATGLWPRSTWLGSNLRRLPAAAAARGEIGVTLDDGPDPAVTPQVLDLLDAHGARATFFCIAERAAAAPALCREIVRRGHGVQNHTRRHPRHFSVLGLGALRREIGAAQQTLAHITGEAPRFFRAPAGLRSPLLDPVLQGLGLQLVSWTRRGLDGARRSTPDAVLGRLTRGLGAGDVLLLHDGNAGRTAGGTPVVLDVLPRLLARIQAAGWHSVTLTEAQA